VFTDWSLGFGSWEFVVIAFLRGRVIDKQPNRIIVDVSGVGYEVHVPLSTFYEVGDEGAEVSLRVYTHVREETLQLYGFLTDLERLVFERLIGISGIGPKLAIAVLSGMDSREVITAIQRADVARLTGIPGIGKKTAERIVLELKDRLMQLAPPVAVGTATGASAGDRLREDLLSALQNLGYHRPQAEKAIDTTLKGGGATNFEQALRGALREMMKH
jgi:Holliday junction DNA helicase RuvA